MSKRNCPVRLSLNDKIKLKTFQKQLEAIENNDIAMGEIVGRMMKGADILERLKQGSKDRINKR